MTDRHRARLRRRETRARRARRKLRCPSAAWFARRQPMVRQTSSHRSVILAQRDPQITERSVQWRSHAPEAGWVGSSVPCSARIRIQQPPKMPSRLTERVRNLIAVAIDIILSRICEILTPAYCQRLSVAHSRGVAHRLERARNSRGETVLEHEIKSSIKSVSRRSKNP
jgi:hypothetical protein